MDDLTDRYATWKAPAEDGAVLLWPDADQILRDAEQNGASLRGADGVRIQNVPLPELRRALREFAGHTDESTPIFATGHQAELHHPGVWAKNLLIDAAATRAGGVAVHVSVDTDALKHLQLRWPGDAAGERSSGAEPLTDDPEAVRKHWAALVDPPTPAHLRQLQQVVERASSTWGFRPVLGAFLDSMRRLSLEMVDLPAALTNALHELDWSLGLRYHALLASPLWRSQPYLAFVHHICCRADVFAADYNAALAGYRARNRIRSPGRPMPDLAHDGDRCEVPFWLDRLHANERSRATLIRQQGQWSLRTDGNDDAFRFDASLDGWRAAEALELWLRRQDLRLAPRALTLTLVLRLMFADQFVHGIGGAQYDQVADDLIARHFAFDPPRFCVTTATLYFPEAAGRERACVACVKREGHRLKHSLLGQEKTQFVEQIAGAPRRSPRRRELFATMHQQLAAVSRSSGEMAQWETSLRETLEREQAERTLFDRELFYALQSRERLEDLISQYRHFFRT